MVCSQGGISVDSASNSVSAIGINEEMPVVERSLAAKLGIQPGTQPLAIMAVWLREASEGNDKFEVQVVIHLPGAPQEHVVANVEFIFATQFHRVFVTPGITFPGFPAPGIMKIESRIRKVGQTNWMARQFFYIALVEVQPTPLSPSGSPSVPLQPS
jgi:hypothetical protein